MHLCLKISSVKNFSRKIFLAKKSTDIVDACQRLKIEDGREDDRLFDWRQIHGREGVKTHHPPTTRWLKSEILNQMKLNFYQT